MTKKMPYINRVKVNFDEELRTNFRGYNKILTGWWNVRTSNRSHKNAYMKISKYISKYINPIPCLVIDYGCGTGCLIEKLASILLKTEFIGIDGSSAMLKAARINLENEVPNTLNRIKLLRMALPSDLSLPNALRFRQKADLITFTFPHILSNLYNCRLNSFLKYLTYNEIENAVILAESKKEETVENTDDPELLRSLLVNRVISWNLHSFLKRGGYCVRVELANAKKEEFPDVYQKRFSFQEGSLEKSFTDTKIRQLFKFVNSEYHHSKVIEDAYEQTGDESDRKGGYWITLLKAI